MSVVKEEPTEAAPPESEAEAAAAAPSGTAETARRVRAQPKSKQARKLRKQKSKTDAVKFRSAFKFRAQQRKRSQSFPSASKFFLPYKRPRKETIVPPTKFLLGGNISDPLNLNSLRDEDVNRAMNAVTPKSSPLPTPPRHRAKIDVIIPPNIRDPLNLLTPLDNDEYEKQLARRQRKRAGNRRRRSECGVGPPVAPPPPPPESPRPAPQPSGGELDPKSPAAASPASPVAPSAPTDPPPPPPRKRGASESEPGSDKAKKPRRQDPLDKIVSPVVPQPGAWMRAHPLRSKLRPPAPRPLASRPASSSVAPQTQPDPRKSLPTFKTKDARYQYGNYDRYYGYRNLNALTDVRLKVFELNRHLFNNKDVLDIGCNVGHVTIAVARDFGARSVTGIDIDKKLIARARKNIKEFIIVQPSSSDKDKSLGEANPNTETPPERKVGFDFIKKEVTVKEEEPENRGDAPETPLERMVGFDFIKKEVTVKEEEPEDSVEVPETPPERNVSFKFIKEEVVVKNEEDTKFSEIAAEDRSFETATEELKTEEPKKLSNRQQRKMKRNRRAHHKPTQELIKHYFPISCPILYGPTQVPGFPVDGRTNKFPQNIVFKQANYVLKDENLINGEVPKYDLIMCLSVSKWFHLNWGDAGIKMAFKRMFAQLRPGGKLILEAQGWASYKKKKKLTETIYKNFSAIEFFPSKFKEYLLSPEVGFSKCIVLGVPQHLSKGFRRPIHLYIKGDFTPSKVQWSDTYAPSHHQSDLNVEEQPKKKYAYVVLPSYHPSSSRWSENNTPSYGAATPYAHNAENNTEDSPFYNPRSDSYMPSYSGSDQPKTVYASLSSPQSDYCRTPSHNVEGGVVLPKTEVYATMDSPASPFLEPSPGNSTTPSHPFTPSHSASYEPNQADKRVYASLHSPHEDGAFGMRGGHPVYSPSVAGTSRCGASSGHSPLYTGPSTCPPLDGYDCENANSDDSMPVKSASEHVTPAASPLSDVQNATESERNSPRDSNDTD